MAKSRPRLVLIHCLAQTTARLPFYSRNTASSLKSTSNGKISCVKAAPLSVADVHMAASPVQGDLTHRSKEARATIRTYVEMGHLAISNMNRRLAATYADD